MSTKIYNAYRIKTKHTKKFLEAIQKFYCENKEYQFRDFVYETFKQFKTWKAIREYAKTDYLRDKITVMCDLAYHTSVTYVIHKNYIYMVFFGEQRFIDAFVKTIELEDYHYQNQCDRPNDISSRNWNKRKKIWNELFGYQPFNIYPSITLVNDYMAMIAEGTIYQYQFADVLKKFRPAHEVEAFWG